MKHNLWTLTLAAAGLISLASLASAEEAQQHVLTALSSTTLSGYVSTSAIWKFGTGNANMPGRTYDGPGKQDGFNLDVVKLTLEKPLDEGEWSAGYRIDVLAGPDAVAFNQTILGPFGGAAGGAAIRQAYVNLRVPVGNGLDFKMGVFDTCIGYESADTSVNPHYSTSYGYFLEPFQHTGILASYQATDWMTVAAGVANTMNSAINGRPFRAGGVAGNVPADESEKTFLGLITLTAPESFGFLQGATLNAGIVNGLNGTGFYDPTAGNAGAAPVSDTTHYYAGLTVPTPLEGLTVGAAYEYRGTEEVTGFNSSTYANATSLYLSYQATEKLKLNNRVEYASGSAETFGAGRGTPEEFFGETFTVDYSLWANVISRIEFRWDHDLKGGAGAFGGFGNLPSDGDKNALSLAFNVIYKF